MPSQNTMQMLNFILGLKELNQRAQQAQAQNAIQQAQIAEDERRGKTSAISTFTTILGSLDDPKQAGKFINAFSDTYHISRDALQEVADNYFSSTPQQQARLSAAATKRAQAGGTLPGETPEYAQLSNAVGASTLAGTTPAAMQLNELYKGVLPKTAGEIPEPIRQFMSVAQLTGVEPMKAAMNVAAMGLPTSTFQKGAQIAMGVTPSADANLSASVQYAAQALQRELGLKDIAKAYDQLAMQYLENAQRLLAEGKTDEAKQAMEAMNLSLKAAEQGAKPTTPAGRDIIKRVEEKTVPVWSGAPLNPNLNYGDLRSPWSWLTGH